MNSSPSAPRLSRQHPASGPPAKVKIRSGAGEGAFCRPYTLPASGVCRHSYDGMAEGHQRLQPFVSATVRRRLLQLLKHKLLFVSPDIDIRPLYACIPGKVYRAYYCGTQVDARIHCP